MADNLDKFTKRARRALAIAQQEAQRLHHNYIGTEHLLLGLLLEGEGIAAEILKNLGLDLEELRTTIEDTIKGGS